MPVVQVEYTVPVIALVDTDTGKVDRVVVVDEEIRLGDNEVCMDETHTSQVPPDVSAAAVHIAESAMWPAWDAGF